MFIVWRGIRVDCHPLNYLGGISCKVPSVEGGLHFQEFPCLSPPRDMAQTEVFKMIVTFSVLDLLSRVIVLR